MAEAQKITFFEKKQTACPVCESKFYREDLLSGGGRLLAGKLTEDLRRLYEPSKKFGEVFPLIYTVTVCPVCLFAAFAPDFRRVPPDRIKEAEVGADARREGISHIFPDLDFTAPRTLKEGVASYFFAMLCYPFYDKSFNPTFKTGLCALRASWLLGDMHARAPGDNYDMLARMFFKKARAGYLSTLACEQKGMEPLSNSLQFGPDLDKNYGYDGLIYLASYLNFKFGEETEKEKRIESLEYAKRMIAKVFGIGKASKSRPSALLENAKQVYTGIGDEIARLKEGEASAATQGGSPE